ncbi:MAG TPA: hypothetical protein VFA39_19955 [Steroidobacteraceae bacterium]|nr:hypothetical protein [Steroidobacteraceae bacterium]
MSNTPCPACKLAAESQGFPFDGGWLHPSAEYPDLMHCNFCGAYYLRADKTTEENAQLTQLLSEAVERLRGWSAGTEPDAALIGRIDALLHGPRSSDRLERVHATDLVNFRRR